MIAADQTSAEAVVQLCVTLIAEREASVHALALKDLAQALEQARRLVRSPPLRPLNGIPIAIKDIIDIGDMPNARGSPIYAGFRPLSDAACVGPVRNAGAVVLGKTGTAEFASSAPGRRSILITVAIPQMAHKVAYTHRDKSFHVQEPENTAGPTLTIPSV